jgi:hypothetical protein
MKNLKHLAGTAVMAGLLLTTGCVKNEEADGVKALREAQAELIKAKAQHETALDEADAAYRTAEAALKQAEADYQKAQTEAVNIANELAKAKNKVDSVKYQIEIETLKATQQAKIDAAVAKAEQALAEAKLQLEKSQRALEIEIASANLPNTDSINSYYSKYTTLLGKANGLRSNIIAAQKIIANYNLQKDFDALYPSGKTEEFYNNQLARQEQELATAKDWKTKYEAVIADPATLAEAINTQKAKLTELREDSVKKEAEVSEAQNTLDEATAVRNAALKAYSKADTGKDHLEKISSEVESNTVSITDYAVAEEVLEKPQDEDGFSPINVHSLKYCNDEIETANDALTDAQEDLDEYKTVLSILTTVASDKKLTETQTARDNAYEAYMTAENKFNTLNQQEGYPAEADYSDELKAAKANMDSKSAEYVKANTSLTDKKGEVNTAVLDKGLADYFDLDVDASQYSYKALGTDYNSWYGDNDKDFNEDLVDDLNDVIAATEEVIADKESDLAEAKELKTQAENYIAYLKNLLGPDADATVKDLKDKYFTAKEVYETAQDAKDTKDDELAAIKREISYIRDFVNNGNGSSEAQLENIKDELESIENNIVDLNKAIQETKKAIQEGTNEQDYLEKQIKKEETYLNGLQAQLNVIEEEAKYYLGLINEELAKGEE